MDISAILMRPLIWTTALCAASVVGAFDAAAQQPPSTTHAAGTAKLSQTAQDSRVEDLSLADVDLSTAQGMRLARERHSMAERVRRARGQSRICISAELHRVRGQHRGGSAWEHQQTNPTVRNSVTRAASVSVADLNLSTIEGYRVARERLETMARRLCAELARRNDPTYRPNWAACVNDTIAGAMAQTKVLAAEKETPTAQRT